MLNKLLLYLMEHAPYQPRLNVCPELFDECRGYAHNIPDAVLRRECVIAVDVARLYEIGCCSTWHMNYWIKRLQEYDNTEIYAALLRTVRKRFWFKNWWLRQLERLYREKY